MKLVEACWLLLPHQTSVGGEFGLYVTIALHMQYGSNKVVECRFITVSLFAFVVLVVLATGT